LVSPSQVHVIFFLIFFLNAHIKVHAYL